MLGSKIDLKMITDFHFHYTAFQIDIIENFYFVCQQLVDSLFPKFTIIFERMYACLRGLEQ